MTRLDLEHNVVAQGDGFRVLPLALVLAVTNVHRHQSRVPVVRCVWTYARMHVCACRYVRAFTHAYIQAGIDIDLCSVQVRADNSRMV